MGSTVLVHPEKTRETSCGSGELLHEVQNRSHPSLGLGSQEISGIESASSVLKEDLLYRPHGQ